MSNRETSRTAAAVLKRLQGPSDSGDPSRAESARAGHIDFTLKDGRHKAFAYAHLLWLDFNPSGVIVLNFSTHSVTIKGRNMAGLLERLLRHEVKSLVVTDERYDVSDEREQVINVIFPWQKGSPKDDPLDGPTPGGDDTKGQNIAS